MTSNFEASGRIAAKILHSLYENGLKSSEILPDDFLDSPTEENAVLLNDVVGWLVDENIIRIQDTVFDTEPTSAKRYYKGCVLTSQGFDTMGKTIEISGEKLVLSDAIRETASSSFYANLGEFFGKLLGNFYWSTPQ